VPQKADQQIVEGGHHPTGVPARQANAVLLQGDVPPVVESIFDAP
jgi:hypothetical protein